MIEPKPAASCCVCGQERKPHLAGPYAEQALLDPFCSSSCCQTFYCVETLTIGERKAGHRARGVAA